MAQFPTACRKKARQQIHFLLDDELADWAYRRQAYFGNPCNPKAVPPAPVEGTKIQTGHLSDERSRRLNTADGSLTSEIEDVLNEPLLAPTFPDTGTIIPKYTSIRDADVWWPGALRLRRPGTPARMGPIQVSPTPTSWCTSRCSTPKIHRQGISNDHAIEMNPAQLIPDEHLKLESPRSSDQESSKQFECGAVNAECDEPKLILWKSNAHVRLATDLPAALMFPNRHYK